MGITLYNFWRFRNGFPIILDDGIQFTWVPAQSSIQYRGILSSEFAAHSNLQDHREAISDRPYPSSAGFKRGYV